MTHTVHRLQRRMAHLGRPAAFATCDAWQFEGYASLFGVADDGGDMVQRGAFAASLRNNPASHVRMLYQHFAHEPIGVWEEIREDARGLYVRGRLIEHVQRSREVMALLREGALSGLSIGFRTKRARRDRMCGLRILEEIALWEISVVTFPLLPQSRVTAVGAKGRTLAEDIREAGLRLAAISR